MNDKYKYIIQFSLVFFLSHNLIAQDQQPISDIKSIGRYIENQGIELRIFPDRKSTLEIGLINGFLIERSDVGSNNFIVIDTITAFSTDEWENILNLNVDNQELELAKDFYDNINNKKGGDFDFQQGISSLKNQKSVEDFEFMVFILTAIKDENAAQALGLRYVDNTVTEGETYSYRIGLVSKNNIYDINSIPFTIKAEVGSVQYENKVYVVEGDQELSFVWIEIPELSGYFVERLDEGADEYVQLNTTPIYTLSSEGFKGELRSSYNDVGLTNYKTYSYKFFGYTAFGERIQFAELEAMPRDLTSPQNPFLKQPQHFSPNEVLVEWEMNSPVVEDLKGFIVARSDKNTGDFKIIHPSLLGKNQRSLIDTSFITGQKNYYIVQAIDEVGNLSSSFPVSVTLIDSIPPLKPIFISGKIDSMGVVTLDIELNEEKDLMGYRLYTSNSPKHEFSVIQEGFNDIDSMDNQVQTRFVDTVTLKTLTPYIYYRAKALDYNYNQSQFSDILKVKRPDTIPPTTPVFKRVQVSEYEVKLSFALSKSIDVVEHILYRRLSDNDEWKVISILDNIQKNYIDTNVTQGVMHSYSLRAKDDSDNYSDFANSVSAKPFDNGVRPVVTDIQSKVEGKILTLEWIYSEKYPNAFFIVYKKDIDGNLRQFKKVNSSFFKQNLNKGLHEYAIKAFTKNGGESKISEIISINID